jgi:general secretion pathway protein K
MVRAAVTGGTVPTVYAADRIGPAWMRRPPGDDYPRRMPGNRRAARGAAVILAMVLAALAAAVAVSVFADQQRWSRGVLHRRDQAQAQAIAMAGIQWARQILEEDGRTTVIDHLGEPWAIPLPPIPLENGSIRGAIVDAQGRLNVNALGADGAAAQVERRRIERLLSRQGASVGGIDAIADWIDADAVARPNGAEDAYYAAQAIPGLAANAPVVHVAELAAVRGVGLAGLAAAMPMLTALPAGTPTNVNTAPPEVLAAIVDNLDGAKLAALTASRAQKPFTTIAEFRARLPDGSTLTQEDGLGVRSEYFYVVVEARQGETVARARALVRRPGGRSPWVVWQIVE